MPILVPLDIKTIDQVTLITEEGTPCLPGYGHCFGSDGGSVIPQNMKVAEGRGGNQEIWTLNAAKSKILKQEIYSKCQFCGKYIYAGIKE